jgi:hypothetical protein
MQLVHYSEKPVIKISDCDNKGTSRPQIKPNGLWVSDDSCDDNWKSWCESEGFNLEGLTCVHDVTLKESANILFLRSSSEIHNFTKEYRVKGDIPLYIDWAAISEKYDGIIITPYSWDERSCLSCLWYYGWDCASGCIWKAEAIESIELRESKL